MLRTLTFALLSTSGLLGADWPQFLGPLRNGHAAEGETPLPDTFSREPKILWQKELGSGFAGPTVADGKVIVFHREGDEVLVEALSASDGKPIWKFTASTDYSDSFGMSDGPRATPTVADGRVFVHGADGRVFALDLKSGKQLWSYDTVAEHNSPQGFFGRTCSPLVVGDRLILTPGGTRLGKPAGVIALDVATGKLVWNSVEDEASCSSPIAFGDPKNSRLLCWMRNDLWSLNSKDGSVRQHARFRSTMDASVNAATPVAIGEGDYFISAGYGVGASIWNLEPDDAEFKGRELKNGLFESHYSTPVAHDSHLYGFHDRQETGQTLRCIDSNEGKLCWDSPSVPGGTLLIVGDKLICITEQGELWIVKASPEKFQPLLTTQILRAGHRSYPAYSDGVLFARDSQKLVAVKLR